MNGDHARTPAEDPFGDGPGDTPLRAVSADCAGGGASRPFAVQDGPDAGRRLFFLDRRVGEGDGPVVLLVHGNPECSSTSCRVIAAPVRRDLPAATRTVAPDHVGSGRSDQARFETVDVHHARDLAQLVAALDVRDVTLVVRDRGGPVGIGAPLGRRAGDARRARGRRAGEAPGRRQRRGLRAYSDTAVTTASSPL